MSFEPSGSNCHNLHGYNTAYLPIGKYVLHVNSHTILFRNTEKLDLKDREWTCPACKTHHIHDVNAAKNILSKGLKQLEKA